MTQRQMSIRIGLDGKADIQRDMADIAQSGDATFGQLGKAIDDGTAALQRQKQAFDNIVTAQQNVATQKAGQNWFNTVLGVNPGSGAGSAQASAASINSALSGMEQRAAALRAQIDPLGAAQGKMNSAIADANTLLAAGAISEAEHAAAVRLAQKAYEDASGALKGFAAMEGVGSTQSMALFAAIRHMIDATVAGRPPLQSLAMEAGNLSYGLSGSGGVLNAVKAVGAGIGTFLLSPIGLAIAAFVAVGGAAYLGWSRATEAQKQFTDATQFAGRAAGLTQTQFEGIAEQAAKASDISVNSARDIESAFAKSGTVQQQSLLGLIALTDKYARATGQDMDTARDALVKAFSDPAKGGEQLLASLGGLDDKTKQYLDTLVEQNRLTDAQTVLEGKLTAALKGSTDQTGFFARAWDDVKRAASGATEVLSHLFQRPSLAQQKAALEQELAAAQHPSAGFQSADFRSISQIKADLAAVDAQIAAVQQHARQGAADAAATTLSNAAGPLVRGAIPGYGELQKLQNGKAVLDQINGNQAALAKLGATTTQVADAQDAYTRAIQTYLDPAAKAQKLGELEIASINAKTPAQKAAIARQQEAINLSGKLITTAQANAQIQQAGAKAYASAQIAVDKHTDSLQANLAAQLAVAEAYLNGSAAGEMAEQSHLKLAEVVGREAISGAKNVAQLRDETDARKLLNDQVAAGQITTEQASRQMALQSALAPLIVAQSLAEGAAKAELTKIIAALTAARTKDNAEADRSKALAQIESGNRNIALLQQELAIANDNDGARQIELALLQEKQRLLTENISAESDEGRALLAQAGYAAKLNQQLDLAKESRGELESMFDTIGNSLAQFTVDGKFDFNSLRQEGLSVAKDLESEFLKLAALNPLKNMLFGSNLPDLNSVGGVLGSLFGNSGTDLSLPLQPLDGSSSLINMLPNIDFGVGHGGMNAGFANNNRALPPSVLRFAPRFHSGAFLGPDEVPAVLQMGERVLNRQETKDYNNKRGNGGVTLMPGAIQIVTPNPGAFQASSGQILTKMARAIASARG